MRDESSRSDTNQIVHGGLLLVLLPLPMFFPVLTHWPWYLLAPLLVYAVVVLSVPSLRRSVDWLRIGQLDGPVIAWIGAVLVLTSAVLLGWDHFMQPDSHDLATQLPMWQGTHWLWAGLFFAIVNALLEEIVWRGIFMDALASQLGIGAGLLAQASLFGLAHAQGYPRGVAGVVLAAVYGLLLGLLRLRSQGLLAPYLAHVGADATIYALIMGRYELS